MNQLDGIDVFVKVVQAGSFSAAAKLLGMPVTTVSGKVASLERRLGVTLLHRTTRKLNVTQVGESYFQHCVRALEEVSNAEKELFSSRTEPEGLLRLTAPPDIGHLMVPFIVRRYLKAYPKMRVELIITPRQVDLVGEGVDLAIRAGDLKDSTLITRKFFEMDFSLWASREYAKKNGLPKHPKELVDHSFIAFSVFPRTMKFMKDKSTYEFKPSSRIIVDDLEAVKIFVAGADGIGILPPLICGSEIETGKFVPVLSGWDLDLGFGPTRRLSFVFPPQRFVSPKIQAFIDLAAANCTTHKTVQK